MPTFDWMTVRRGDVLRINGSRPCVVTDVVFRRTGALDVCLASTNGLPRGHVYTSRARAPQSAIWAREIGRPDRDETVTTVEFAGPNTLDPPPKKDKP